jgi:anti-sigma regulatory factor (Ser/Thr protein kinase)
VTTTGGPARTRAFAHYAFFYQNWAQYTDAVCSFVRQGLTAGEPALVAVPSDHLGLVRNALGEAGEAVSFADMAAVGRNPARIIPAIRRFTDNKSPGRTRFVGEPIWPGRSPAGMREATRHEALINTAFAGVPTSILCPYDSTELGEAVLGAAWRTHPRVLEDGSRRASPGYSGAAVALAIGEQPLPSPPPWAKQIAFLDQDDLPAVREWVTHRALREGLSDDRALDLVTAVNEVATNTVVHTKGPGIVGVWRAGTTLFSEVCDDGRITDPLAGRHLRSPAADGGQGLRVVNELCDLVELRSGSWGTTVRLHILCG